MTVPNSASTTLATTSTTQTLTNKTLTTPYISGIKKSSSYSSTISLPSVSSTDTFTLNAATQTLTNKTLTTPIIASIKPSSSYTLTLPTKDGTLATTADIPDSSSFATLTGTQTLTNKTLGSSTTYMDGSYLYTGGSSKYKQTFPSTSSTLVNLSSNQTISGTKTFSTAPIISSIKPSSSYTLTVPSKTSTLGTLEEDNSEQAQILYLAVRLEALIQYLASKSGTKNVKTICDEICQNITFNRS